MLSKILIFSLGAVVLLLLGVDALSHRYGIHVKDVLASMFSSDKTVKETADIPILLSLEQITVGSTTISVEIADTDEKRIRGLSGHEPLPPHTGMLFIFDTAAIYPFWMKDMRFSIDIIWISENMRVVDITKEATPESYPTLFKPKLPSRYVLEVPAGTVGMAGLTEGDLVVFK